LQHGAPHVKAAHPHNGRKSRYSDSLFAVKVTKAALNNPMDHSSYMLDGTRDKILVDDPIGRARRDANTTDVSKGNFESIPVQIALVQEPAYRADVPDFDPRR
jgi:hypothetical protein